MRTSFWGNRTAEVRLPLVWGATALDNIFSDRLLPDGEPVNRIRLDACRNEYEPGQFVISSLDYRGPVRLKLNALAHETDPAAKLTELTANFVKEIYASQNTVGFYRNPKSPLLRPAPATFPDMLSNDDTTMLEPGRSQPVWLTVRVPGRREAGLYRGRVEVQTMFGVQPLEVEMRVYDVALPEVPIFRLGTWGSARLLANLAGFAEQPGFRDPRYWTLFEKVLRNMKEHRAYNFGDPPLWEIRNNIRITDDGKGGVEIDYSTFDRFPEMLDKVYGKGNWRVMSADIPLDAPLYGRDGKVKYNPFGRIQDLRKRYWNFDDPEFNAFAVKVLRNLVRHLTEKGWIGQFQFIYRDEPDPVMFAQRQARVQTPAEDRAGAGLHEHPDPYRTDRRISGCGHRGSRLDRQRRDGCGDPECDRRRTQGDRVQQFLQLSRPLAALHPHHGRDPLQPRLRGFQPVVMGVVVG